MPSSDHELLAAYLRDGSQSAFAEVVSRYVDLVYSAARRQLGSSVLSEEIAQSVFTDLARQAHRLSPDQPLAAWLHLVTRRTAIDVIRRETRRRAHEQQAAEIATMKDRSPDWTAIEPLLDEAVESLPTADRTAILLRFFQSKSLRDVGAALGVSDDAAQKRVTRAVDQLRSFFLQRGIAVTAAGLVGDLSAHAIETAPTTLGASIATTAALGVVPSGATATGTLVMTTLQKSLVVAALVATGAAIVYQSNVLARQSADLAGLHRRASQARSEIDHLTATRSERAAQLSRIEKQIDARLAQAAAVPPADAALESQMQEWLAQVDRLKEFLARRADLRIPELSLLRDQDWFAVASAKRLATEDDIRRATAALRHTAENRATLKLLRALQAYVKSHDGLLPNTPLELAPQLDASLDPAVLERYQMLRTGRASDVPVGRADSRVMTPKSQADPELDAVWYVGLNSYGNTGTRR